MAEREVRYCTTEDGVRIAYCVEGEGPPLVIVPVFVESFSLEHLTPSYGKFIARLGEGRMLIRYDIRGTGLSQREVTDVNLRSLVADIKAVITAAALGPVSIWANAASGSRAIEYAAHNPDDVRALILYGTQAVLTESFTMEALESMAAISRTNWEMASRIFADLGTARLEAGDAAVGFAEQLKQSTTGEVVAKMILADADYDPRPIFQRVRARTLVIHRVNDSVFPLAGAQAIAAGIPGARMVTLPGAANGFFYGDSGAILSAAIAFLDEDADTRRASAPVQREHEPSGPFRTVLFTDVVENTALLRRIGDEAWRAVMREHEEIVRAALKEHGGTEISTSGDGFFASFGSSVRALQCAVEMQRAFAHRNETAEHAVEVRIGLNAGEPIEEGKEVLGTAVTMAARIMSQAGAGEILVSDVVRQLVAGKGFLFADRGEFVAKGFEEPVRVYEVRWRKDA